jgi:hypothetical protein
MFQIENGRDHFFQWDLNQRLIVNDAAINQVHFCNRTDSCSLVVDVYEENGVRLANVPNVLLQTNWDINVYGYCGSSYTKQHVKYKVKARSKPSDYVYTETEVRAWDKLAQDIERTMGDVDAALDRIIEIQNNLLGGGAE